MIVKVPIYFDVEVTMSPDEAEEFIETLRKKIEANFLKAYAELKTISFQGNDLNIRCISRDRVLNKLTGHQSDPVLSGVKQKRLRSPLEMMNRKRS